MADKVSSTTIRVEADKSRIPSPTSVDGERTGNFISRVRRYTGKWTKGVSAVLKVGGRKGEGVKTQAPLKSCLKGSCEATGNTERRTVHWSPSELGVRTFDFVRLKAPLCARHQSCREICERKKTYTCYERTDREDPSRLVEQTFMASGGDWMCEQANRGYHYFSMSEGDMELWNLGDNYESGDDAGSLIPLLNRYRHPKARSAHPCHGVGRYSLRWTPK